MFRTDNIIYLVVILFYIIQSNPVNQLVFYGFKPNLVLYFILAVYIYDHKRILIPGILAATLFELTSVFFPGFQFFLLFSCIYIMRNIKNRYPELHWLWIAFALVIYNLIGLIAIKFHFLNSWNDLFSRFVIISLPDIFVGAILAEMFYWILTRIFSRRTDMIIVNK